MSEIIVKYRKGLPTEKCMNELIHGFWGSYLHCPRVPDSYKYNACLIWDRKGINEKIDSFCEYLTDNGVKVKDYDLYNSPSVGHLRLEKSK